MIGPELHGGGHPWHGLCTGGVLALPNAASKTYPQPSGGDCFKLAVPGFAAPARSAAQGLQWLGHALLSGDSSTDAGLQVYGKPLGRMKWLWAVSPHEKWRVDASALVVAGGNLSGNLVLTEFGLHWTDGRAAASFTVPVSAAAGIATAAYITILDVNEDGSAVLLGFAEQPRHLQNGRWFNPLPQSVVRLSLSNPIGTAADVVVGMIYSAASVGLLDAQFLAGAVTGNFVLDPEWSSTPTEAVYRFRTRSSFDPGNDATTLPMRTTVSSSQDSATVITTNYSFVRPAMGGTITAKCSGTSPAIYDFSYTIPDIDAEAAGLVAEWNAYITAQFFPSGAGCGGWEDAGGQIGYPGLIFKDKPTLSTVTVINNSGSLDGTPTRREKIQVWASWSASLVQDVDGNGEWLGTCHEEAGGSRLMGQTTEIFWYRVTTQTATGASSVSYQLPIYVAYPGCGANSGTHYRPVPEFNYSSGTLPTPTYTDTARIYATVAGVEVLLSEYSTSGLLYGDIGHLSLLTWHADRYTFSSHGADLVDVIYRRPCRATILLALRVLNGQQSAQPQLYARRVVNCVGAVVDEWDAGTDLAEDWRASLHPDTQALALNKTLPVCYV